MKRIKHTQSTRPADRFVTAIAVSAPAMETYAFFQGSGNRFRGSEGRMLAAKARAIVAFDRELNGEQFIDTEK